MTGRMFPGRFNVCLHVCDEFVPVLMNPEYVISPADFVSVVQEDLKPEAAAPLLCGMSLYAETVADMN